MEHATKCPSCGGEASTTLANSYKERADAVRRRRQCKKCGHRFSTYEIETGRLKSIIEAIRYLKKLKQAKI
jgi:transcriptional regulator NrdR family protein